VYIYCLKINEMPRTSIFRLSDNELDEKFWVNTPEREIMINAAHYKTEIADVLNSRSTEEVKKLKALLSKLRTMPSLHQWVVFATFWDAKRAVEQYELVEKWRDWYGQAQYKLLQAALVNPDEDWEFLNNMIECASNLNPINKEHWVCCLLVGDVLYKTWDKQWALDWYKKVEESSPDFWMAKKSIITISEEIEKALEQN
jgi:hypothetical protein